MKINMTGKKTYIFKAICIHIAVVFFILSIILVLNQSFHRYKISYVSKFGFSKTSTDFIAKTVVEDSDYLKNIPESPPEEFANSFAGFDETVPDAYEWTKNYFEYDGKIYGSVIMPSDPIHPRMNEFSFEEIDMLYTVVLHMVMIPVLGAVIFLSFFIIRRLKKYKSSCTQKQDRAYLKEHFEEMILLSSKLMESASNNDEKYLSDLLKFSMKIFPEADCGSISLIEEGRIRFIDSVGHDIRKLQRLVIKTDYLANSDTNTVIVDNLLERNIDKMPYPVFIGLKKASRPIRQSLISKFRLGGEPLGNISIDISSKNGPEFSEDSKKLIEGISSMISAFYAVKKNLDFREKMQKDLILSMVSMLEIYDTYTKGHSENVANLAKKIAEKMSLPEETVEEVYWSSLVHDIGKILIPTTILNKPDKLTNGEFEIIKMHPVWGFSVLNKSKELEYISVNVRSHHERWDGNGYPDGIGGENIPLVSRILAVADAYDAMTSDRAYRKGIGSDEALTEIKNSSGRQFDPDIVELFVKMMV